MGDSVERDSVERVVTHKSLASVARLMGYTPQGLIELCEACLIGDEWRVIGTTRPSLSRPVERIAARISRTSRKLEFSVGNEAFALTNDAAEQQRIREEIADQIVKRVSQSRPVINPRFVKANQDHQGRPASEDDHGTESSEGSQHMIISPVAPRDPRGLEAAERRHSGPGNTKSGH